MKKIELLRELSAKTEMSQKDVDVVLGAFAEVITDAMKEQDEVTLPGVGKFSAKVAPARVAKNPMTGEDVQVPEKLQPKFKASTTLKANINA